MNQPQMTKEQALQFAKQQLAQLEVMKESVRLKSIVIGEMEDFGKFANDINNNGVTMETLIRHYGRYMLAQAALMEFETAAQSAQVSAGIHAVTEQITVLESPISIVHGAVPAQPVAANPKLGDFFSHLKGKQ